MFCFSSCKDPGTNEEALVPMPFLLPEMFASMLERNNRAVEDLVEHFVEEVEHPVGNVVEHLVKHLEHLVEHLVEHSVENWWGTW